MLKRRRKFELWLADINKCLADPSRKNRDAELRFAASDVFVFIDDLRTDSTKAGQLIQLVRAVRDGVGPGRTGAEGKFMEMLCYLAEECCLEMEHDKASHFVGRSPTLPSGQREARKVLEELTAYAFECLRFQRPQDSFGGRRRGAAFEILAAASRIFELSEGVAVIGQNIKKARQAEIEGMAELLKAYFGNRNMPLPEDLIRGFREATKRAKNRTEAFAALNVLVQTGAISERKAFSEMGAWKERRPQL